MFYVKFLILLFLNKVTFSSKSYSLFYSDMTGTCFIGFYINKSIIKNSIRLSFSNPFNYMVSNPNYSNKEYISTNQTETIIINNKTITAEIVKCSLCFNMEDNCIDTISFYNIQKDPQFKLYDTISLSKQLTHNEFSTLHQLKLKGMIDTMEFSFIPTSQDFGRIHFGRAPETELQDKYKYVCKSSIKFKEWGCELNQIIFTKNNSLYEQAVIYHNSYNVIFDTLYNQFYVPYDFFTFISENIFIDYVKQGKCALVVDGKGFSYYECGCSDLKDFPKTNFVFEGFVYDLGVYLMFEPQVVGNKCNSLFYYKHDNNNWIIGNKFLHNYISVFDVEKGEITFYTKKPLESIFNNDSKTFEKKKTINKILMFIINSICFVNIIVCCYIEIIKKGNI